MTTSDAAEEETKEKKQTESLECSHQSRSKISESFSVRFKSPYLLKPQGK